MRFLIVLLLIAPNAAATEYFGPYKAEVIRVIDGDTIAVEAFTYPGEVKRVNVRVNGVDTPELKGKCEQEKRLAVAAKKFTESIIGQRVNLLNVRFGKFAGRIVANVKTQDGKNLDKELIAAGLGRFNNGSKRQSWCG